MIKIFLTHPPQALENYYGPRALAQLRECGEVVLNPEPQTLSLEAFIAAAQGCQVIVSSRDFAAPAELFQRLPQLAAYCRVAVDIRNIDVEAAGAHGVLVTRATPGFDTSVSEWVLGAMLDLSRDISRNAAAYWQGQAPQVRMGRELRGATLGIVGYGFIGQRLAQLAALLGMRVLVNEPYRQVAQKGVEQVAFKTLLGASDYVVCLAPAVAETADLFSAEAFAAMRDGAFFINASRGELVDETALRHALDNGPLAGCAVDVGRAPDQMPTAALAAHPRVIASPHIGGLTPAAAEHQAMDTVRQVRALCAGQVPEQAVNAPQASRAARLFGLHLNCES